MKQLKIIVILLLSGIIHLHAQHVCEANNYSSQAEINYRQKTNLTEAVDLYKSSFKLNLTDASKVLDAINVSTMIKDTLSTIEFLQSAISVGLSMNSLRKLWNGMGNGMDLEHLISTLDTAKLLNQYQSQLDTHLIHQLSLMVEKDQKYRDEEEVDWNLQGRLDSLNWEELKRIVVSASRLPRYKESGFEGNNELETLFHHMDKETIEWFLPYIVTHAHHDNANLSSIVLYQLDRIGMMEGIIYTISEDLKIIELCERTKMRNGLHCQSFGEWFDHKNQLDSKIYEHPIEPKIPIDEINRVRGLFCLDTIDRRRNRRPWVQVCDMEQFEDLYHE